MGKNKKTEPSIEELCKKYDNILPLSGATKVPLVGIANCNK